MTQGDWLESWLLGLRQTWPGSDSLAPVYLALYLPPEAWTALAGVGGGFESRMEGEQQRDDVCAQGEALLGTGFIFNEPGNRQVSRRRRRKPRSERPQPCALSSKLNPT
jgi:hypothetical protein